MGCTDMAKYFEVFNSSDDSILIDDTFKNLQLLDSFPLSECKFNQGYVDSSHGYYGLARAVPNALLIGIGINNLANKSSFALNTMGGGNRVL